MNAQNYDPWKRVDDLENKVRELEARIKAIEPQTPVLLRPVITTAPLETTSGGTLHLRKEKH